MVAAEDRAEWLAAKRSLCGGSDVARILGLSRFGGPWDVWASKVDPAPDEQSTDTLERGRVVEAYLRATYEDDHGVRVTMPGLVIGPEPWMGGTPDGLVDEDGGWEGKTAFSRDGWSDEDCETTSRLSAQIMPPDPACQVAWYLELTDREWWDVSVAFVPFLADDLVRELSASGVTDLAIGRAIVAVSEVRHYHVMRDRDFGAALRARLGEWWARHIAGGEEPPFEATDASREWLRRHYPRETAELRPATADETALIEQWAAASAAASSAKKTADDLAESVKRAIGEAEGVAVPAGRVTWKWQKGSTYTVTREATRVLRRSWRD